MSPKTAAREFLLQFLYHFQLPLFETEKNNLSQNFSAKEIFDRMLVFKETLQTNLTDEQQSFVTQLVGLIFKNLQQTEVLISKYLKNWKITRISRIEHTLLIMSGTELLYFTETPSKVVINEALELAKKYSTKESSGFINGILDSLLQNELKK